ncbi:energy transducer TonB [Caulobacter sp. 17J80-11]|uniref:energy transducer TonB n=1 Tax=Caulobacter sp. 17J80-11 TaxID=2763502 RepID=UPI0016535DCF|nr:energy transducer TonB [Caulobacter sp. 17J80-11]MBC6980930.1 energy transducer TonB [Caulobacter sp. 17J80-11]
MTLSTALVVLALLGADPAVDPSIPPPVVTPPRAEAPRMITAPQWASLPGYADLERFFPRDAQVFDVAGKATIECVVRADGALVNCAVLDENPVGWGFGAATVAAADAFRMRPTVGGRSVEGARVRVPVRWTLDGSLDNSAVCAVFEAARPGPDRKARVAAFQAAIEAQGEEPKVAKARAKYEADKATNLGKAYPERMSGLLAHCQSAAAATRVP